MPKQASENVICQKEWSWRRKLKRQMRCLPMISCPPRRSLTRCGTGWARPSTASAVASLTLLPFFSFLTQSRPWCVLLSARNGVEQRRSRILLRRSPAHRHRMRHGSRRERKYNPVPAASRSPENLMASRQEYKLAVESVWFMSLWRSPRTSGDTCALRWLRPPCGWRRRSSDGWLRHARLRFPY